jgi:hypothetical protein
MNNLELKYSIYEKARELSKKFNTTSVRSSACSYRIIEVEEEIIDKDNYTKDLNTIFNMLSDLVKINADIDYNEKYIRYSILEGICEDCKSFGDTEWSINTYLKDIKNVFVNAVSIIGVINKNI